MSKYDTLRKKIEMMKKEVKGCIAPYLAYLITINDGYELSICFWDGREGSGDKMPTPIKYQFSQYEKAEEFLLNYFIENKPINKFVLFTNENDLEI